MKKLLLLIALVLPMIAVAGPEDHTPGAVYKTSSSVPWELMEFAVDTAELSDDGSKLILDARYGNLKGEFKITKLSRHNEDRVNFVAEGIVLNRWESGCGEGAIAKMTIAGETLVGEINVRGLQITVEYTSTNDTCHSRPQTEIVKYELL